MMLNQNQNNKNLQIQQKPKKDLKQRIVTVIGLISFAILFLFFGSNALNIWCFNQFTKSEEVAFGAIYFLMELVVLCVVVYEIYHLFFQKKGKLIYTIWLIASSVVIFLPTLFVYSHYFLINKNNSILFIHNFWWIILGIFLFGLIILSFFKFFYLKQLGIKKTIIYFLIWFLVCTFFITFSFVLIFHSWTTLIFLWLPVIFNDTFAYLGGRKFGKHHFVPKISPKKTTEGLFFGIVSAIVIALVIAAFYLLDKNININFLGRIVVNNNIQGNLFSLNNLWTTNYSKYYVYFVVLAIFGLIIAILGTFGDLLFSYIKRQFNIKDFSNLLPGHGGVLDRIDSIIVVLSFFGFYCLICYGINSNIYYLFPFV